MKYTVTVFLIVGAQLGLCQLRNHKGLHKNVSPLNMHYHPSCPPTSTKIFASGMGPCYDTPGCELPECCGIISGADSNFTISYRASKNMKTGRFDGDLGGLGLTDPSNPSLRVTLPLILVPGFSAGYDPDICNSSPCPQKTGKVYTLNLAFKFPTTALTTAFVYCDFVAHVLNEKGETIYCGGLYARLVNIDLVDSMFDVLKNPLAIEENIERLGLGRILG